MARILLRRQTAADWATENPVLLNGEPGYETDTGKQKIGDGVTAWNSLAELSGGGSSIQDITGIETLPNESNRRYVWAGTSNIEIPAPISVSSVSIVNLGSAPLEIAELEIVPGSTVVFETDSGGTITALSYTGIPDPQVSVTGQGLVWVAATRTWAPALIETAQTIEANFPVGVFLGQQLFSGDDVLFSWVGSFWIRIGTPDNVLTFNNEP